MSYKTLAAHVAERISMDLQKHSQAQTHMHPARIPISEPGVLKPATLLPPGFAQAPLPPPTQPPSMAASWLGPERPAAWLGPERLEPTNSSFFSDEPMVIKRDDTRRSSASTTASGASADSVDFSVDGSDAASVTSGSISKPCVDSCCRGAIYNTPPGLMWLAAPLGESMRRASETTLTTLKIANIPRRCGKEELLEAIKAAGFADAYDFFYLPLGPQSKKNHGYAFINFGDNATTERFARAFSGYPLRAKVLDVTPAPLQGLARNLENFATTRAAKCDWVPNVVLRV